MDSQLTDLADNTPSPTEESTLHSSEALELIEHSSDITLNITTPVGRKFFCHARFIGPHSSSVVFIEPPQLSFEDWNDYFQEGFWLNAKAIGQKGFGAVIHFRSQIKFIQRYPFPLIALSIPHSMKVRQLRKEPRYDVKITGRIIHSSTQRECEIRNLSKNGCQFSLPKLGHQFYMGEPLTIEICDSSAIKHDLPPLEGLICNVGHTGHNLLYGLQFNEEGRTNVQMLLKKLRFNGSRLSFG
ncbi:flagellar brake protein [Vibrio tritonius]|uniref:Flagellar brake protein n=1 Tax=Vibrio tritonius TaxID=1435069 RepID=A0ABS7YTD1_9VIBR|nr:PilZ domain-containing protein [Vibrio tritonius]MCA2018945.1 flagellar brake protein [Vibrio tritonius]